MLGTTRLSLTRRSVLRPRTARGARSAQIFVREVACTAQCRLRLAARIRTFNLLTHSASSTYRRGNMRRTIAILAIALLAAAAVAATAIGQNGDVLISDTQSDADYHAEGRIALGGNIQIQSDRAPSQGQALQNGCDPDPSPAPNNRPGCSWATPQGSGREQVNLQGQIGRPDTDRSPNKSYTPDSSDTREILNGLAALQHDHTAAAARANRKVKARAAQSGQRFEGDFFNDEDMHIRLTPRTLDAYLAPEGNANNRWRRICGTGVIEQFNTSGGGNNDPRSPFLEGQIRKFVLQIWDADWREPSNADGGNQDYYIIDILAPGSNFDTSACQAANPQPQQPAQPGQPAQPAAPAAPVQPASAPSQAVRGTAALAGARGCQARAFRASVVGRNIAQVVYLLDGKRYRTLTKATAGNRWSVQIVPSSLKVGSHRVTAGVSFVRGATPRVRAMSFAFQRCAKAAQAVRPRLTG